jgi:hypothetical protein
MNGSVPEFTLFYHLQGLTTLPLGSARLKLLKNSVKPDIESAFLFVKDQIWTFRDSAHLKEFKFEIAHTFQGKNEQASILAKLPANDSPKSLQFSK